MAKALGKGFGSLIPSDFDGSILLDKKDRIQKLLISDVKPDPKQPRKDFVEQELDSLADSIKRYGILQPLVVVTQNNEYIIVAGERRHRAAHKAGLSHVPAIVRTLEDLERLEIGLIENVQRVDLSPLEQALSIARLHEEFNISIPEVANRLGKAHSTIVNIVRLLQLPEFARESLAGGKISEGHARAVLALKDDEQKQQYLVNNIEKNKWSVRRAEQYVNDSKNKKSSLNKTTNTYKLNKTQEQLVDKLRTRTSTKVDIFGKDKGGQLRLYFKSLKELETILQKLTNKQS